MEILSKKNVEHITKSTDFVFSLVVLITIISLIVFSVRMGVDLFLQSFTPDIKNIIHNLVYIIVLLKAYRIMVFYFKYQNLSIKYLVQIAIIAPAIEVIFAINEQSLWINILYATFSLINLLIYLTYYEQLNKSDVYDRESFSKGLQA